MATFKTRIEDLAGTIPATADGEQFLKDGVVDVVHKTITAHPQHMPLFAKEESIADSGEDVHDVHVLEVTRDSKACREIPAGGRHGAADSSSMFYASSDDPVYFFLNEQIDVLPTGGTKTMSILTHGTVTNWDSGSSAISYMPEHHYNQVIMYAGIQTLHHKMVESETDADITTAITAINTELDETQGICDNIHSKIGLASTEVGNALTEIGEAIGLVDNASNIQVAVDGMKTANAKFRADGSDPALFGDESTYDTGGSGMTKVKAALNNAISLIGFGTDGDKYDAGNDLEAVMSDVEAELNSEDIELAGGRMQQAQTQMAAVASHLNIAQAQIAEWNTVVQTLVGEVNSFSAEAGARYGWINAKSVVWQGELAAAQGYMGTASGYASEIQTKIGISQGYAGEVKVRMDRAAQKYQWYATELAALQQQYNTSFMVTGQQ